MELLHETMLEEVKLDDEFYDVEVELYGQTEKMFADDGFTYTQGFFQEARIKECLYDGEPVEVPVGLREEVDKLGEKYVDEYDYEDGEYIPSNAVDYGIERL